jgi:hypothetical protein
VAHRRVHRRDRKRMELLGLAGKKVAHGGGSRRVSTQRRFGCTQLFRLETSEY